MKMLGLELMCCFGMIEYCYFVNVMSVLGRTNFDQFKFIGNLVIFLLIADKLCFV